MFISIIFFTERQRWATTLSSENLNSVKYTKFLANHLIVSLKTMIFIDKKRRKKGGSLNHKNCPGYKNILIVHKSFNYCDVKL